MDKHRVRTSESESTENSAIPSAETSAEDGNNAAQDGKQKKKEWIRVLKFLLFSCSAGAIQLVVNFLLYDVAHLTYWVSYLIALVASVIWNFTFNRKFTFKSASNVPVAMLLVFLYYCAFTPLSTLWGHYLEGAGWPGMLVTVFSMAINLTTEFLWQRFVVFRKSIDTAAKKDGSDKEEQSSDDSRSR